MDAIFVKACLRVQSVERDCTIAHKNTCLLHHKRAGCYGALLVFFACLSLVAPLSAANPPLPWQATPSWKLYRWEILGFLWIFALQSALVVLLIRINAKRKRAESQLRKSEGKFSKAFRASPMGFTLTSLRDYRYLEVNHVFEQATGWRREEVIGRRPFDLRIWDDPEECEKFAKRLLAGERLQNVEFQFRTRTGELRTALLSAELIDIDDEPCMLSALVDITDHKLTDERSEDSQKTLSGLITSAMDAIIGVDSDQKIFLFNHAAEKMFCCSFEDALGKSIETFIPERFRAAHITHVRRFGETGATSRAMGSLAPLWAVRSDGEEFPIDASISRIDVSGKSLFTVIIRDVTERRQAEAALRESEERFRLVADRAPVMIWMSGTDKLCTYFNQPWLDFTGCPLQAELGDGWTRNVHPDDLAGCMDTYVKMFDQRLPFDMQYRLRRCDGEYRWVYDHGVPRFNSDNSFEGYIGCCIDVTEERKAKATLAEFSGRLIQAQEEERARIARELHDDISQRMALLSNLLQELAQTSIRGRQDGHNAQIRDLLKLTGEIATDIQHMSHQLHPSKLRYLGLAGAARHLCQEFSKQQKTQIECVAQEVPHDLDDATALNLFRIIQESLRNIAKHSHAQHAKVELVTKSGVIRLRVSDDGVGFDLKGLDHHGLGLVSMQERLRSLGGEFSIRSDPSRGTQVEVTVPLKTKPPRVGSHDATISSVALPASLLQKPH